MKRKLISVLLCLSLGAALLAGCGSKEEASEPSKEGEESKEEAGDDTKYGLDMEEITIATSPGYEPFEFEEDGELKGYDVDIWKEFEERTGIKVKWEYTDFSGLLGLLQSGKADVVAAQMTPTPDREAEFGFSNPVSYYGSTVVVSEDNEDIKSVDDLAGKVIGVGSGNDMQQKVQDMYEEGEITFETYTSATLETMFADLEYERIDAVLAQDIQTYVAMKNNENIKVKVLDPFESSVGCLVTAKDNETLLNAINEFLADLQEDGTMKEISEKWIGEDISVESK